MFEVHFKVRYIMFICALCLKKKKPKKTNSLNIYSLKLSLMEKKVVITIFA